MFTFLLWVFFAIAAGMFASIRRGRSGGGWFLIALFFSPLVAFVLLAILKPIDPTLRVVYSERSYRLAAIGANWIPAVLVSLIAAFLLFLLIGGLVYAQQTVIRDASGRTVGTATTDSGGQTVFRDASGRTTGTANTPPGSDTVLRDAGGRTIGTISPDLRQPHVCGTPGGSCRNIGR